MSILIKNMEMPKKKNGAVIIIYPDGQAIFEDGTKYDVIEIPPHGRLIDADALTEVLLLHLDALDGLDRSEMAQRDGLSCAIGDVADTPTIIESEGEDG